MTITEVNSATFLADAINLIRDKIKANITDPVVSVRPSGQRFVFTSYPKEPVVYPVITITDRGITQPQRLGMGSEGTTINLNVEIRIWARNVKERDELFDSVYNYLRTNQISTANLVGANLSGFQLTSAVNIDEIGIEGIKSKVMEVRYLILIL